MPAFYRESFDTVLRPCKRKRELGELSLSRPGVHDGIRHVPLKYSASRHTPICVFSSHIENSFYAIGATPYHKAHVSGARRYSHVCS
jgi:hypothetical protein